jgi:hypothetical protein
MDILSLIGWRTEGPAQTHRPQVPDLKVGDRLQGRVARLLQQDLAVVELFGGRFKAVAQLRAPLVQGQRLQLQVTATQPRLTFQSVAMDGEKAGGASQGGAAEAPQGMRRQLDPHQVRDLINELKTLAARIRGAGEGAIERGPVSGALERLAAHLRPLEIQADPEKIAARLQERVRDGGLFFELKLAAAARQQPAQPPGDPARRPVPVKGPLPESRGAGLAAQGNPPRTTREAQQPVAADRQPLPLNRLQNDLKPNLQRLFLQLPPLMEELAAEQRLTEEGSRQLWSTAANLLEEIEIGQRRLAAQRQDEAPAVIRQSLWLQGRDEALRFNVYLPRKRGEGGRGDDDPGPRPMVALLLELDRFGKLRVDVRERYVREGGAGPRPGKRLAVDFWAASEEVRDELQTALAPLTQILEALYPRVELKISLAPEKIASFDGDAPPAVPDGSNLRKLDLRV